MVIGPKGVSAPFYPLADVVYVLVVFLGQRLTADETHSLLLHPQSEQPPLSLQFFYHPTFEPVFKVEFPLRVIGVRCPSDFAVSFDWGFRR